MVDRGGKARSTAPRFPSWGKSLGTKLAVLVAGSTLAAFAILGIVGLRVQEHHLVNQAIEGAALFSGSIVQSTHDQMLRGRKDEAYAVMDEVGRVENVRKVRLFNKEGRVTFSTDRGESGVLVPMDSESCAQCHASTRPATRLGLPERARIDPSSQGRILGLITPIYNEPSCVGSGCHAAPESPRVLGVVDVQVSLASMDADLAALRRTLLALGFGVTLALIGVLALSARRVFIRPVRELVAATRDISRGRLDQPILHRGGDELGLLAESFESMRTSLLSARREIIDLMSGLEQQVEDRTRALRSAQEQLVQGEKLASLGKLSASIAHEINNPLAGILTFSKLLIRDLQETKMDDGARAECVSRLRLVQRETERCSAIVRNLLDFARQRPATLRDVDLYAALEESLALVDHQIALQGVRIEKDLEGRPLVQADFGQLRQAFVNVFLNACEAMTGGGVLRVTSAVLDGGEAVEIVVADNGVGIDPGDLSKIFDPFFTTKEQGTGLGLSVVYGIVQGVGGTLRVVSRKGEGTEVRMRFPVLSDAQAEENAPARASASPQGNAREAP
jgi:two-component system NtrC family sensor kinase